MALVTTTTTAAATTTRTTASIRLTPAQNIDVVVLQKSVEQHFPSISDTRFRPLAFSSQISNFSLSKK